LFPSRLPRHSYQQDLKANLTALFSSLQPNVVAFQGEGLVASPVRWVGSESGLAPYPCWSTCDYASYGAGDPNAATWFAAETDFTLQNGDNCECLRHHANVAPHRGQRRRLY
jgi:hypothetical protein